MGIQLELNKARVPVNIWTRDIEAEAMQQLLNVASLPIVHPLQQVRRGKG